MDASHGGAVAQQKRSEPVAATSEGPFVVSEPCPVCHGQGTINEQPCAACHGTGVQRFYHGTKADLKPGDLIEPGHTLQLR